MSLLSPFEKEHGLSSEHQPSCIVPNSVKINQQHLIYQVQQVSVFLQLQCINRPRISPAEISSESYEKCVFLKQEAHGPHGSPEKIVQNKKHLILLYHNVKKKEEKNHQLLLENLMVLHLNKLECPSSMDALCQFG